MNINDVKPCPTFFFSLVVLTAAIFLMPSGITGEQRQKGNRNTKPVDHYRGLQLSVGLDAERYRLTDEAIMRIKLTNIGKEPIMIYRNFGWGWSSSFSLSVSDAKGRTIQPSFLDDHLPAPPFPTEDFLTLGRGEMIEKERELNFKGYGIKKPGVYRVTVFYHSPIPRSFAPVKSKIWPMEYGDLQAKEVRISVE
jgi:hypothetical protein